MGDFIDEDLLKDYFDEAFSQIEIMEENILIIEKDPTDKDAIDELFRAAHTLKGGSATVQMNEISGFTHVLEDVMDEVRSEKVKLNSKIIDILLESLDIIKSMVNERSNGNIYENDYSGTIDSLKNIINKVEKKEKKTKSIKKTDIKEELLNRSEFNISEYDLLELNEANPDNLPLYKVIVSLDESNPMRTVGGIQIFTSLREISLVIKTVPEFDEIYSDNFHKEIMYIVASSEKISKLQDYATIPDATEKVVVLPLKESGEESEKKNINNIESDDDLQKKIDSVIRQKQKDSKTETKKSESIDDIEDVEDIDGEEEVIKNVTKEIKKKDSIREKIKKQKIVSSSILRVDSSRIDTLLNLISEIVINKATFNQISIQFSENLEMLNYTVNDYKDKLKVFFDKIPGFLEHKHDEDSFKYIKNEIQKDFHSLYNQYDTFFSQYKSIFSRFKSNIQILDRISGSLQEGVMRVRMVPMKQIFNRFPRLVRDLSRELEKDINLIIHGEDTEIDKAMIDDLIDPLIHIVRNSIDHGFETIKERKKLGKPIPATLEISAQNEGNIISISVRDDGRGIDVDKIRKKAISKDLITADDSLKDQDAYNLLFNPGFSTADKVTAVSGRGVGLDVVKKNIEKLSGSIRITSEIGLGSEFSIKIPLTLAIIQGLMVNVSDETYVIPISSVIESIRIKPTDIKSIDNYEVINVRDDVLSLLRLNKLFNIEKEEKGEYHFVIIVGTGNKKIGILVDSVIGEEDIVIKPLKDKYTNTPGIAGATILGDGTVSLILDVSQLIELGLKIEKEEKLSKKKHD